MLRIALLAILAFASVRPLFGYDLTNPILDYCYHVPDPNPTLESPTGLTKILWVICATDSAAIQPYDSLPFGTGGHCGSDGQGHRFRRETYPSSTRRHVSAPVVSHC